MYSKFNLLSVVIFLSGDCFIYYNGHSIKTLPNAQTSSLWWRLEGGGGGEGERSGKSVNHQKLEGWLANSLCFKVIVF